MTAGWKKVLTKLAEVAAWAFWTYLFILFAYIFVLGVKEFLK